MRLGVLGYIASVDNAGLPVEARRLIGICYDLLMSSAVLFVLFCAHELL